VSGPLVSIGIPTYRRPREMRRAVESALAQAHANVEVIVSDDASGDDTPAVLAELGDRDDRLRYEVQSSNLGHARNFQRVADLARGDYFMWLSDDDWLDPGYVSACLAALDEDPSTVLAVGRPMYHRTGAEPQLENPANLLQTRPGARMLAYYATVDVNGPLYGLARRGARPEFRELLGGDWLVVGALAHRGRVRTLEGVHVHRSLEGMSTGDAFAQTEFGVRGNRHVQATRNIARAIASGEVTGTQTPAARRAFLAAAAASVIAPRFLLIDWARSALARTGLLPLARRAIAPLRARRHS
jgi:hypothetical protein